MLNHVVHSLTPVKDELKTFLCPRGRECKTAVVFDVSVVASGDDLRLDLTVSELVEPQMNSVAGLFRGNQVMFDTLRTAEMPLAAVVEVV